MNPIDGTKLDELLDLLRLNHNATVIDIGSGKGEILFRLVEKYGISGVGIDKSPYAVREALKLKQQRVPNADVKFLEMDAAKYKLGTGKLFDLSMCIGASWIYDGYRGTVRALKEMTKPSGYVMIGEPFWRKEPPIEYLEIEDIRRDLFDNHYGNVASGESEGLRLVYTLVSNEDNWDKYEGLHWYAADQYAIANPNDQDLQELWSRDSKEKMAYLKWGREYLGWAIYLFRKTS